MANWSLPTTSSTYVNYTSELDSRLNDLAYMLDPAVTTVSNTKTNSIRWTSASSRWEKYNGTAWVALASTYAINAATADAWSTGRTVSFSGDLSGTSAAWTGSTNLSLTATLATVNSNTGSFGSATAVPIITVNAKGLITAVSTAALGTIAAQAANNVSLTGGSISGTAITLVQSTTAAPTAEGRLEWDTDDDLLKVGTGTVTKTMADTDSTQTLTNKTLSTGSTWSGNAIALASGGTGATTAAAARTNLGIADMGTQTSSGVSITGGAISGTSITLVQSTTAAPTAEGRIEWDTDDDLLVLGTAAGTKIQVNTNSVQTLTNKTLSTGSVWNGGVIAASYIATLNQDTTGNAATATKLQTARTINGISFDGSGNITLTANTTNAVTFTNSATAAAAGATFNGSAAVSINYATVGAPSVTGSGASGTWAINVSGSSASCTGNSATVTNGVYTSGDQTIAGVKTFSGQLNSAVNAKITLATGLNMFHDSANAYMDMVTGNVNWRNGSGTVMQTLYNTGDFWAYGNVTAYSDERIKTNWRAVSDNFLERVAAVKHGIYDRIDSGVTQAGVSAQSWRGVLPETVTENQDGMLSVSYGNAALVTCIELAKEIMLLKAEIAAMKGVA
jgi:hypothetical protein